LDHGVNKEVHIGYNFFRLNISLLLLHLSHFSPAFIDLSTREALVKQETYFSSTIKSKHQTYIQAHMSWSRIATCKKPNFCVKFFDDFIKLISHSLKHATKRFDGLRLIQGLNTKFVLVRLGN